MSRTNPVPRGFADQAGTATAPTRCSAGAYDPHTAAHLTPGEVDALLAALRRQRDRAIVLGGLRLRGPRIAFELYRRQDDATRLAAGGARPILEVVGPLAELNDDPWVDVVRRLEDHARRLGSTCRAFPSGSAITIQLASPWPMSIRVGPEEVETVDLRLLITVERWSEVEMQPVLPGLRHQWRTTPT